MLKQRLHVLAWFILINSLLAIVIASRYFAFLPELPSEPLSIIFIVVSTISQMVFVATLIGLISLPTLILPAIPRNAVQALIASLGITVLLIDTVVFAQYRFHINAVVLDLVLSGQVVSFPLVSWIIVIGGLLALVIGEWLLIRWLERGAPIRQYKLGRKFALIAFLALLTTNGIHIWAAAHAYQPVTVMKRYLPLFYPATSNTMMKKYGWINQEAVARQKALTLTRNNDLSYPLTPLVKKDVEKPVNIMFLVVDSWRQDTFNAENTPHMWKYAQSGKIFNNHIATGNATRTAIFSLFYGIPGTYWHGFFANRQSPLFIDRLQELDYELGIFAAAKLDRPEFDRTVFTNIKNLRNGSPGRSPSERDANLTKDWLDWYTNRDQSKPAFSFLFYDAPHGYDFPYDYEHRYEPMATAVNYLKLNNELDPTPILNRYKTSVHYSDSMAKKVLDLLSENGDLDNTVVIITGDHSQEINDNGLNFWGHNSNFTDAQVKVPFAIVGAGITNETIQWDVNSLTSHQDVVPTLMKNYLGVSSSAETYSVGEDLLSTPVDRNWVISSNYSGYSIITDDTILEVGVSGQYQLMDKTNRPIKNQQPNFSYLQQALEQISRFNK